MAQKPLPQTQFVPTNLSPAKSKKDIEIDKAISHINSGYKVLILLRGLPGSGKSTLARSILEKTVGYNANSAQVHILSADDYFNKNGAYIYNPNQISEAHGWNHNRAFRALSKGISPVVIDNTNTQLWEMKPYAVMAIDYGYVIEILEPSTHWCFNEKELVKRNRHGVSKDRIKTMLERYEKNITTPKLLSAYKLFYKETQPPDIRLYPPPDVSQQNHCPTKSSVSCTITSRNAVEHLNSNNNSVSNNNTCIHDYTRENINLMDFNESTRSPLTTCCGSLKSKSLSTWDTMDTMLMYQGSSATNTEVLQPKKTQSFLDARDAKPTPNWRDWGVDEQAIRSWDIVTPLEDTTEDVIDITEEDDPVVETSDACTNTEYPVGAGNVLKTYNRDINRNTYVQPQKIPKKLMLDKSCITEDIYEDREIHIEQLNNLFPHIPTRHLNYWYDKCKGDMDWTIELILLSKDELLNVSIENEVEASVEAAQQMSSDSDNTQVVNDSDSDNSHNSEKDHTKTKSKRKNNNSEALELKKCIESKVNIGDDWYSSHLLKIKQIRFGNNSNDGVQPSTSKSINNAASTSRVESLQTTAGEVIMVDSDVEFDDLDLEMNTDTQDKDNQHENGCVGEVETMELNLGDFFVRQLETNFGDSSLTYPKGFQPVVQLPVTLAKQLYTFYIESVFQQLEAQNAVMESLVKEDEDFARKLQDEEEDTGRTEEPKLKDIMTEQAKLSKIQKEVDKWKDLTPDTLAARLTRDKLYSVFPTINRDVLVEILQAHDNKYEDTVETLLASTTADNVRGSPDMVRKPPLDEAVIKEMRDAQEYYKKNVDDAQDQTTAQPAVYYREIANKYLKKRTELYEKAQKYYQRGMTAVAQFYSGLASKQTDYYDRANHIAATSFLDEHAERLKDFNTLDLHYLYVKEAMPALDLFLDRNINLLRLSDRKQAEYLQIITGRGNRSQNGVSKIRPAVSSRLKKRNIKFQLLNPGLLKIKIMKNTLLSSEL